MGTLELCRLIAAEKHQYSAAVASNHSRKLEDTLELRHSIDKLQYFVTVASNHLLVDTHLRQSLAADTPHIAASIHSLVAIYIPGCRILAAGHSVIAGMPVCCCNQHIVASFQ